jgi:hypothetical protein
MEKPSTALRRANAFRWVARIWSATVLALAVVEILVPDAFSGEPVPAVDWFLVSLWLIAILGLMLAWKWELFGASLALAGMVVREIAFYLLKGYWTPLFLIVWLLVIPPALLFLVAWGLERKGKSAQGASQA